MHQWQMSPTYLSGKLLVGHPNGYTILTEEVTTAIKMSYPAVQISLDKFGLSKIVNLGVLCGTYQQESHPVLKSLVEAALHKPGSLPIPVKVTWESIYTRGEHQPASTKAHFIKCRMEDIAWATLAFSKLYGFNITKLDPLCPLVRFIPMSSQRSSDSATRKVITHQCLFLKSTCMASLKNIRPLESNIQLPNSTYSITISHLFTSIQDEHNNCLFHAVVPYGHTEDQILVASTRSKAVHICAVQQDALSFLQISYPWLNAEDIFQNVDETITLLQ